MSGLMFQACAARQRIGLKGPRGADWLVGQGIALPSLPNSWTECGATAAADGSPLVARLGASEFFLETAAGGGGGAAVRRIAAAVQAGQPGVYPVLREDASFLLSGEGALDALAQVCNVNFAALDLRTRPVVMTLLIGVSVLIIPYSPDGDVQYRIWCDPTFGSYIEESVAGVVVDCGGSHGEMSA